MQTLDLKACHQQSAETREHLVFRGFRKGIENFQVGINLRKNLGDADMALDKALGRALHIEAVTRIEKQDSEPHFSHIKSNENSQLFNSNIDLLRTLQSNQSNRQVNQIFHRKERGRKNFCAEMTEIQEKPEIEIKTITAIPETALIIDEPSMTVERNRQHQEASTDADISFTRVVPKKSEL